MKRQVMVVAACGLLLGAGDGKEKRPATDRDKLQGTWVLVSGERNGKPLPDETVKHVQLTFARDKLTTATKDRKVEATYKLNPDKAPKEIDLDMDGNVGKGIYQLDGDTLKIAHGEVGEARPKEFPKAGSGLTVLVLKRKGAK